MVAPNTPETSKEREKRRCASEHDPKEIRDFRRLQVYDKLMDAMGKNKLSQKERAACNRTAAASGFVLEPLVEGDRRAFRIFLVNKEIDAADKENRGKPRPRHMRVAIPFW
jgi:hypothetical protein